MRQIDADELRKVILGLGAEYNGELLELTSVVDAIDSAPTQPVMEAVITWLEIVSVEQDGNYLSIACAEASTRLKDIWSILSME